MLGQSDYEVKYSVDGKQIWGSNPYNKPFDHNYVTNYKTKRTITASPSSSPSASPTTGARPELRLRRLEVLPRQKRVLRLHELGLLLRERPGSISVQLPALLRQLPPHAPGQRPDPPALRYHLHDADSGPRRLPDPAVEAPLRRKLRLFRKIRRQQVEAALDAEPGPGKSLPDHGHGPDRPDGKRPQRHEHHPIIQVQQSFTADVATEILPPGLVQFGFRIHF